MTELFVDRIEGEVAVLLVEGAEVKLPRAALPPGTREGEVLQLARDPEATARARARVDRARGALGESDDGGDLKL